MIQRVLGFLVVVLCAVTAIAGDGRVRRVGRAAPGQYIAVFEESVVAREEVATALTKRFGARTRMVFAGFPGFSFEANDAVAAAIARDPHIAWVEENAIGERTQVPNLTTRPFPPGWAIDRTNTSFPPLDNVGGPGCNQAAGIRVYVVDTGINDPDTTEFGTRLRHLYKTGVDWSYQDSDGHGTAVASGAAGRRHGLASQAEVVNVKISVSGTTYTDYLIDAISYIDVDHYHKRGSSYPGGAVVNISWYLYDGYTETSRTALDVAVQNSVKGCTATTTGWQNRFDGLSIYRESCTAFRTTPALAGLTYVVGAGNNGHSVAGSPARLGDDAIGTITVGATRMADEWTTDWRGHGGTWGTQSSNFGPPVDIWAPGTDVDVLSHNGGGTKKNTGTSHAAPLVAGHVARLLLAWPSYTTTQLEQHLKDLAVTVYPDGSPVIRDVPGGRLFRYTPAAQPCR